MKRTLSIWFTLCLICAISLFADVPHYINFQGTLTDTSGNPITGTRSIQFSIYADSASVLSMWTETQPSVEVTDGLFRVSLGAITPLSPTLFNGATRWLGIRVSPDAAELSPRQSIRSVPYSFRAIYSDTAQYANVAASDSDWTISGSNIYRNTGNVGIGTTSPVYKLQVEGQAISGISNLASGVSSTVSGGGNNKARGQFSVIAGGGGSTAADSNSAMSSYSSVGGGIRNTAGGLNSTVGGGNSNLAGGVNSTVSGGYSNSTSGILSTVSGGYSNSASGYLATVGGGHTNNASGDGATIAGGGGGNLASGIGSAIGGGEYNRARGDYSVVAGGGGAIIADSNSAIGYGSSVGGGRLNHAIGDYSTIAGGDNNSANGERSTIGGGDLNSATSSHTTVGGGFENTASGNSSTISGGYENTASGIEAFVGGGGSNAANNSNTVVGGGYANTASGKVAAIVGGFWNIASDSGSTVGGGGYNNARGRYSVVAGGGGASAADSNSAKGDYSTVGGGVRNTANSDYATVSGGKLNSANDYYSFVGGGVDNIASGYISSVSGGTNNTASGNEATVVGGFNNTASGDHSVAMGQNATASGTNSFAAGKWVTAGTASNSFVLGVGLSLASPLVNNTANSLMVGFGATTPTLFVGGTSQYVGIKTSTPRSELHVEGTITVDQKIQADDAGGLELATDEGTTRLIIRDNGNVGVGTTAPGSLLHVYQATGNPTLKIESDAGAPQMLLDGTDAQGTYAMEFREAGTFKASLGWDSDNDHFFIYQTRNAIAVDNGNVGINTTTPAAQLDVNGTTKLGSSGTIFNEVKEITDTLNSTGSLTTINLPSGYTYTNTRILSVEVNELTGRWFSPGFPDTSYQFGYELYTSIIYIVGQDNAFFHSKPVRILLMKIG
jgi:hypothetical protein